MVAKKIAENVYANVDYDGGNVSCVSTEEGLILIDTPTLPRDIEDWKAFIHGLNSKGIQYIINTHIHFDHMMGNNRIGGKVVMHRSGGAKMLEKGATLRETIEGMTSIWSQEDIDFILSEPLIKPSITMSDEMTIYLGEYTVRLHHSGGHTPDSIIVYVVEGQILITGDNLTAGSHPFKGEASFLEWIDALEHMKSYDIQYIIPGHGEVCGKEEIDRFIEYFKSQWEMAENLINKGHSQEIVVDKIGEEMFGFFDIMPERMQGARMMFDIGTGQLYKEVKERLHGPEII